MAGIHLVDGYSLATNGDVYDINEILNNPEYQTIKNKVEEKKYFIEQDYRNIPSNELYVPDTKIITFFIGHNINKNRELPKGEVLTLDYPEHRFGDYKHEEDLMIELRIFLESYFKNKVLTKRGLILNNWGI
jgi:hypothetical protein